MTAGVKCSYVTTMEDCKLEDCGKFYFMIDNRPKRNEYNKFDVHIATLKQGKEYKKGQLKGIRRRRIQMKLEKEKGSNINIL